MLSKRMDACYTMAERKRTEANPMMYPFLQLNDKTEIVHSEMKEDGRVKVYIEKPVSDGFYSATCYLPNYEWTDVEGFTNGEIKEFQELIESVAHLVIRYSQQGGFENASSV